MEKAGMAVKGRDDDLSWYCGSLQGPRARELLGACLWDEVTTSVCLGTWTPVLAKAFLGRVKNIVHTKRTSIQRHTTN